MTKSKKYFGLAMQFCVLMGYAGFLSGLGKFDADGSRRMPVITRYQLTQAGTQALVNGRRLPGLKCNAPANTLHNRRFIPLEGRALRSGCLYAHRGRPKANKARCSRTPANRMVSNFRLEPASFSNGLNQKRLSATQRANMLNPGIPVRMLFAY